jgi:hypothetical protein
MKWPAILVFYLSIALCATAADGRKVTGTYRNYAEGFSVKVPAGLEGIAGDEDGPERGVRILLRSGGSISVYGEPNSLEWKSAGEGVRWELAHECKSGQQKATAAIVGTLSGAQGEAVCGNHFVKVLLVFRPKGGPIYWLRLETSPNQAADEEALKSVASSFKLITWR